MTLAAKGSVTPTPDDRYKPCRAGILNVWEYDDQVFHFGDGRLVLRGRNGSGKSNALSLLFPFILDATMGAARMDPMGGARSMKSLLLCRDDDSGNVGTYREDSATGYVWMEFERAVAASQAGPHDDIPSVITIGIGVSVTKQTDAVPWFFVAPGAVGSEIHLETDGRPLSRTELTEVLGPTAVFRTAQDYRSAVDRALLGLGTDRYRIITDLLLTLRRPQLAGRLNTEAISDILSAGMAEVDPELIGNVAHSFDDLDAIQNELDAATVSRDALHEFLPVYREHLYAAARQRAERVIAIDRESRRLARERSAAAAALQQATDEESKANEDLSQLRRTLSSIEGRIDDIKDSAAYRNVAALAEVRARAEEAAHQADASERRSSEARERLEMARTAFAEAEARRAAEMARLEQALEEYRLLCASVNIDAPPEDQLRIDAAVARSMVTARRHDVEQVQNARIEQQQTVEQQSAAERMLEQARTAEGSAQEQCDQAEQSKDRMLGQYRSTLRTWIVRTNTAIEQIEPAVGGRLERLPAVAPTWDPADPRSTEVDYRRPLIDAETVLASHLTRLIDKISVENEGLQELLAERQRVADQPNPGPDAAPTRPDASKPGLEGVPLYLCVDFAPNVPDRDRPGLEAALHAAGILDARIWPKGADPGDLEDAVLAPPSTSEPGSVPAPGPTLSSLFVPVAMAGLGAEQIEAVLRRVPIDSSMLAIGTDGRWRLGPTSGRYTKVEAQFIGHEARERRRRERLAELDIAIAATTARIKGLEQQRDTARALRTELVAGASAQPSAEPVRSAMAALTSAYDHMQRMSAELTARSADLDEVTTILAGLSLALQRLGQSLRLPIGARELTQVTQTLHECTSQIRLLDEHVRTVDNALAQHHVCSEQSMAAETGHRQALETAANSRQNALDQQRRFEHFRDDVSADSQQAIASLEAQLKLRGETRVRASALEDRRSQQRAEIAGTSERIVGLDANVERVGRERTERSSAMAIIHSREVWEVIFDAEVAVPDQVVAAAKYITAQELTVRESVATIMEQQFRSVILERLQAGNDPSMPTIDSLQVVRIGTAEGDLPIGALSRRMDDEVERLEGLFSDREREIFETHLLDGVANRLRLLLSEASQFQNSINVELAHAPTSSGITVSLKWELDSDDPTVKSAVQLLDKNPNMIGPAEREELRVFFTGRIQRLRAEDRGRSFAEILTEALDYRRWHRFTLYARVGSGRPVPITRTFFAGKSGGEQALILHLPLFAAAASHYSAGGVRGPRIIALDEAFAGIDEETRERLMRLLVHLDLDVIITSHEFWGVYGGVPQITVYDLVRQANVPGVFAQRFDHIGS